MEGKRVRGRRIALRITLLYTPYSILYCAPGNRKILGHRTLLPISDVLSLLQSINHPRTKTVSTQR